MKNKRLLNKMIILVLLICLSTVFIACSNNQNTDLSATNISVEDVTLAPLVESSSAAAEASLNADNTNSVGPMAFYPNSNEYMMALAGTNSFTFYFKNSNIVLGEGKIGVYDADTGVVYTTVSATDTDRCKVYDELDEAGEELTSWQDGTMIEVYFPKTFEKGKSYYILMDEGVFMLGSIKSKAVTDASLIAFGTKDYGISADIKSIYKSGETVTFTIYVDGTACTRANIKEYDTNYITLSSAGFTEDSTVTLTLLKDGNPSFTISFLKDGVEVDSLSLTLSVGDVTADSAASSSSSAD